MRDLARRLLNRLRMERRAAILGVFLGDSRPVQQLRVRASAIACEAGPVLVHGEPGTGKRLIARLLHRAGRFGRPWLSVPVGALETAMLPRIFDDAGNGTLVLEELEHAPSDVQLDLAAVLRERVAGRFPLQARVVSTCAAEPFSLCERGKLEPSLYQAVGGTLLSVPPLRDRPGDRKILAQHFLVLNREVGYGDISFSPEALDLIESLTLRGNAAQLSCLVMRVGVLRRSGVISPDDLLSALALEGEPGWRRARAEAMREFTRSYLGALLAESLEEEVRTDLPAPLREFVRLWRDGVRELNGSGED